MADRCPVIILAGGKSTRFGRDKASEVLEGKSLLQHVIDATSDVATAFVIVKAKDQKLPEVESPVGAKAVEDEYPETGPLGGIYSGLLTLADAEHAIAVACDMPLLQPDLLRELLRRSDGQAAVAPLRNGLPEPLCAVYSAACIEPAGRLLDAGEYRLSGLLDAVDALLVPEAEWQTFDPEGLSFLNINREGDIERVREVIVGRMTD